MVHDLSGSAISLWHTLMSINNVARWKPRFNTPNGVVQQLSGLSKSGVHVARKKLEEHGFVTYEAGAKGKAPMYEMVSLVEIIDPPVDQHADQVVNSSVDSSVDPSVNPSMNQPCTILKHKLNKVRRGCGMHIGKRL